MDTQSEENHWMAKVNKLFPWGTVFATDNNLEWGYFTQESIYIDKYLLPHSSILIIGSGNGREAEPIASDGHSIMCIDIGEMYLRAGKARFTRQHLSNVHFVQADMAAFPFGCESFDFVFFSLFNYGASQRHAILADIHRIVKPRGIVLITLCTSLYIEFYPHLKNKYPTFDTEDAAREDIEYCPASFKFLESAVDPDRQEYRFAVVRKY